MTQLYYSFIWEGLPHPESVEFSKLYFTYLMKTKYVESVTPTGHEVNNPYASVGEHFSLLLFNMEDFGERYVIR